MRAFCKLFVVVSLAVAAATLIGGQRPAGNAQCCATKGQRQGQRAPPATEEQLLADLRAAHPFNVTIFAKPPDANYPTCLWPMPTGEVFIGSDPQARWAIRPTWAG